MLPVMYIHCSNSYACTINLCNPKHNEMTTADFHFFFMILASFILFFEMILLVLGKHAFLLNKNKVFMLSFIVVVLGMLFGRYGARAGLPWWVYYPIPLLATALLPPFLLKLNRVKIVSYLAMSLLSAPLIHIMFSFLLGWKEYMPFWNIASLGELLQ